MNSPTTTGILTFIEKQIGHLPYQHIQEFIKCLSPSLLNLTHNLFESFYRAVTAEYEIRLNFNKESKIEDITAQIISIASKVNEQLGMQLKNILLNHHFLEVIHKTVYKSEPLINQIQKDRQSFPANQSLKPIQNPAQSKGKSAFNFEIIKGSNKFQQTNNKQSENRLSQTCYNLQCKPQCICMNQREIVCKDQFSFKCIHCYRFFHTVCFKRKPNSQYCSYCYLQKMIPNKRVQKIIYIGLMRKNVKKHSANFIIPELSPNQKLHVRCLRVKDGAQNSCLFPDIAEILINSHRVKQFEPINKQSCLKYRKDEPFILIKGDYFPGQQNNLVLNQTVSSQKQKEVRYESQNHIFAIYVIEDVKIQSLISEMKAQSVLGFSQSKAILSESFKLGKGDDQITCQLVKIPLSCPLSTMRIQIPARGTFCTHFQCFDLKNYLTLISESQNPRWKCPLCTNLAYQLQIDSITQQILNQNKANQRIQQVLFFKNGDYAPIIDDQPITERKNIKNLNIPEQKPKHLPPVIEEKAVKKLFSVPVNAEVIDLDD